MPFLSPNQQHQSTEGKANIIIITRLTALCPGLPRSAGHRKVKTNLDFTTARDSEWQWHQLGHMQVCSSLQTDNHASTPPLFLQARRPSCRPTNSPCPSCCPTNSIKALKEKQTLHKKIKTKLICHNVCLQCFDAVGWVAGRASGL